MQLEKKKKKKKKRKKEMAPSATSPPVSGAVRAPSSGNFAGYDHVTWWVGNAKQAAAYYVSLFGFKHVAYRGLETGSRYFASHVVANGGVRFVFTSPLRSAAHLPAGEAISAEDRKLLGDMHAHLERHGDAVRDVAFEVDDVEGVYRRAVGEGAVAVQGPARLLDDDDDDDDAEHGGSVTTAVIRTYGDTTHTLISRGGYSGPFLPGFREEGGGSSSSSSSSTQPSSFHPPTPQRRQQQQHSSVAITSPDHPRFLPRIGRGQAPADEAEQAAAA